MNNKFIPIISVFMTISLIVFVTLQIYWLKGYYTALQEQFSNRVYDALETASQKINDIEVEKYYAKYKNIDKDVIANGDKPSLTMIQAVEDSASKRQITVSKSIVEKQDIPISETGDSLKLTKLYTDDALLKIKKSEDKLQPLTAEISAKLDNGEYKLKEFAKLSVSNLPITERVNPETLEFVIAKELKLNGIDAAFSYAVLDQKNTPTKVTSHDFSETKNKTQFSYPLFTDGGYHTTYSLALVFPMKNYSLAKNNLPMLLGTLMSLLTILGIYIISINYMMKQKKIAEVKTDFINNMSHEFKTPLATISVATDSLANEKIATNPEKVKYYSNLIKQENLRMKKQVENVLNMSKLERNEVKLFLKETNVRQLIKDTTESFNLIVKQRNGTLTQEFNADKYIFKIDEFHLSNALVNLLDNANKYSPNEPEITVRTRNEGHWYVIDIQDKGMGMESQNSDRIFEKFFREETGNIHNVKGQGLGLSYVKKIIELHKGQVIVDSKKDEGSTFTIKLPMA